MEKEFQRLSSLIEARANATQELARFCLKTIVLANSGALVATLTFMGSAIRDARPAYVIGPLYLFLTGFLSSLVASVLAFIRSYQAMRAEARFLSDVMIKKSEMNWLGNPEIEKKGFGILLGVGIVLGAISFLCFVVGVVWGIIHVENLLEAMSVKK